VQQSNHCFSCHYSITEPDKKPDHNLAETLINGLFQHLTYRIKDSNPAAPTFLNRLISKIKRFFISGGGFVTESVLAE
jgi:hypothetical protein